MFDTERASGFDDIRKAPTCADDVPNEIARDLSGAVGQAMRDGNLDEHEVACRARCTPEAVRALVSAHDGQTLDAVSRIAWAVGLRLAAVETFSPVGVFTHDDGLVSVCETWGDAMRVAAAYVRATHADDRLEMAEDVWVDAIEPNSILL